jgi:peptidoglycan L-alanyl-D-glutamate endopeptidase CwlK
MPYRFSARSEAKLQGVHPDLVKVVRRALELTQVDFGITEGLRTEARQKELVAAGASRTMKSRHLTGHAVDVVAYIGKGIRWDWPLYGTIAQAFQKAADELNVPIVWGGNWNDFKDGCHFELDRRRYP